jgi:tRNA(Ile)-lysidine synthase
LHCAVAWSGGLDSTVLLHCLLQMRKAMPAQIRLRAIHVDHHLQSAATQFRKHCRRLARQWRLPLTVLDAEVVAARGASVEEAARDARYALLASALRPEELLLSAQHADDQMETVLLALLRGAGPAGLAAMPAVSALGQGLLLRPLLGHERSHLAAYAAACQLTWVEDPSNAQSRFDRNYLRASVVPALRLRWPAVVTTVSRSARHCAAADALIQQLAHKDLEAASDGADLEVAVLNRWSRPRRKAVLRAWFACRKQRAPDEKRLEEVLRLIAAREDAVPQLVLPGCIVRRYAGRLMLQLHPTSTAQPGRTSQPRGPAAAKRESEPAVLTWSWRRGALQLPDDSSLAICPGAHGDLDIRKLPARLQVTFLGEASATHGRTLRKQLQELEVPPWERERLPLLYDASAADGRHCLLAIGDLWVDERVRSDAGTARRGRFVWRMPR